jgi:hypothetical protein
MLGLGEADPTSPLDTRRLRPTPTASNPSALIRRLGAACLLSNRVHAGEEDDAQKRAGDASSRRGGPTEAAARTLWTTQAECRTTRSAPRSSLSSPTGIVTPLASEWRIGSHCTPCADGGPLPAANASVTFAPRSAVALARCRIARLMPPSPIGCARMVQNYPHGFDGSVFPERARKDSTARNATHGPL